MCARGWWSVSRRLPLQNSEKEVDNEEPINVFHTEQIVNLPVSNKEIQIETTKRQDFSTCTWFRTERNVAYLWILADAVEEILFSGLKMCTRGWWSVSRIHFHP
jgi:hypothetical protein